MQVRLENSVDEVKSAAIVSSYLGGIGGAALAGFFKLGPIGVVLAGLAG